MPKKSVPEDGLDIYKSYAYQKNREILDYLATATSIDDSPHSQQTTQLSNRENIVSNLAIEQLNTKVEFLEKQFEEKVEENIKKATEELEQKIGEFNKLLKDTKEERNKNIEILALFATLFTFISINIQVFNTLQTLSQALIFIVLFGLMLLIFLIVFFSYSRGIWLKKSKYWWDIEKLVACGIIILLLSISFVLISSYFTDWFKWLDEQKTIPKCKDTKIVRECIITQDDIKKIIDSKEKQI